MDILPSTPTPEALLTERIHGAIDDAPLYATRAIALCRQVARLHKRVLDGNATSRRDRLTVTRLSQANALLIPFNLTLRMHDKGVSIVEFEAVKSLVPAVFCDVLP